MDYIVCHYGEIGLKGKNRRFFEEKLVENIKIASNPTYFQEVKRISGRIIVKLTNKGKKEEKEIKKSLVNVFGLSYFALAQKSSQKLEQLKRTAFKIFKNALWQKRYLGKKPITFKISTQRSKKNFPLTSQEINEKIGQYLLEKFKPEKFKVDLKRANITLFLELVEKYAFFYLEKISGPGGLPVGVSGKAVSLISGGIDSPVASYLALKRGLKLIFLHFHALPYTPPASIEKVKKIVKVLNKFQFSSKLYLVPFGELQKEIVLKIPPSFRVIFYRRTMLKIAEKIAQKEKGEAIITGENLAQVASQTLENLKVINQATNLLILRPLIGQDKIEIIKKAKEIGTYEISILPYEDCCARFLPKHPETKANLKEIEKAEKNLSLKKLIEKAIKNKKALSFSCSIT